MDGKRYGVHEFGSVRYEGKKRDPEKFLVNNWIFQDNIHDVDEEF